MERWCFLGLCSVLLLGLLSNGGMAMAHGSQDGSEEWGYVEVRPSKRKTLL